MQDDFDTVRDSTDSRIGALLLAGLLWSIAAMVAGTVVSLLQGASLPTHVLPLDKLAGAITSGKGPALIDLGILILFATPFLGVVAAILGFIQQRDRSFTLLTIILFVLLCAGFAVATR